MSPQSRFARLAARARTRGSALLRGVPALGLALAVTLTAAPSPAAHAQTDGLQKINHVVVIYQENWSFDSLYGKFPGANGLASAGTNIAQVDKTGKPYTALPQPINTNLKPPAPDPRFPANLPVQPYDTAQNVRPDDLT